MERAEEYEQALEKALWEEETLGGNTTLRSWNSSTVQIPVLYINHMKIVKISDPDLSLPPHPVHKPSIVIPSRLG